MKKRSNENSQIDKFQYNDLEDESSDKAQAAGSFQRVSAERLKGRRIVSVTKKWKPSAKSNLDGKSQPSISLPSGSSNVASGKNLFGKNESTPTIKVPSAKSNPFANIAFAAPSGNIDKNNTQQTVGKPVFSFMPNKTSSQSNTSNSPSKNSLDFSAQRGDEKPPSRGLKDANLKFFEIFLRETEQKCSKDLSYICHNYSKSVRDQPVSLARKNKNKAPFVPQVSTLPTQNKKNTENNNPFSFGTTPTKNNISDISTKNPEAFSGFSFGATTKKDENTAKKPLTSFNFGTTKAVSPSVHKSQSLGVSDNCSKIDKDDEEAKTSVEILREKNEKEEVVFEARSKYLKMTDKKWKAYSSGVLRLYKSKVSDSSKKIVLRNDSGRVQLNLGIYKGMTFTKAVQKTKGYVGFAAVADEKAGLEKFQLMVKLEDLDPLFESLKGLAK